MGPARALRAAPGRQQALAGLPGPRGVLADPRHFGGSLRDLGPGSRKAQEDTVSEELRSAEGWGLAGVGVIRGSGKC